MATSRIVFYNSLNAPRNSRVERGFGVSSHQLSRASASSGGSDQSCPTLRFSSLRSLARLARAMLRRSRTDHSLCAGREPCPSRTLIQLHSSFAGGNSGQVGMDDVLLPAPPLDTDAALDPVALLDP